MVAGAMSTFSSRAPSETCGLDGGVTQTRQLLVELQQRDRATRHLERGDVRPDQVAGDLDPAAVEELLQVVVDDVELDQWRTAHAVDEGEHLVARLEGKVLHDRRREPLHDLGRRLELDPLAPRLPMDADTDLHLVVAELEGRL